MSGRRLVRTAAAWLVLSGLLMASDSEPAVVVLGGIVAAFAAVAVVGFDLARAVVMVMWPKQRSWHLGQRVDDRRVATLRRHAQANARLESDQLHGTLVELVEDRLRASHGIDGGEAPEAGSMVPTPALRKLIEGRRGRVGSARELHRILDEIEGL